MEQPSSSSSTSGSQPSEEIPELISQKPETSNGTQIEESLSGLQVSRPPGLSIPLQNGENKKKGKLVSSRTERLELNVEGVSSKKVENGGQHENLNNLRSPVEPGSPSLTEVDENSVENEPEVYGGNLITVNPISSDPNEPSTPTSTTNSIPYTDSSERNSPKFQTDLELPDNDCNTTNVDSQSENEESCIGDEEDNYEKQNTAPDNTSSNLDCFEKSQPSTSGLGQQNSLLADQCNSRVLKAENRLVNSLKQTSIRSEPQPENLSQKPHHEVKAQIDQTAKPNDNLRLLDESGDTSINDIRHNLPHANISSMRTAQLVDLQESQPSLPNLLDTGQPPVTMETVSRPTSDIIEISVHEELEFDVHPYGARPYFENAWEEFGGTTPFMD